MLTDDDRREVEEIVHRVVGEELHTIDWDAIDPRVEERALADIERLRTRLITTGDVMSQQIALPCGRDLVEKRDPAEEEAPCR